MLNRDIYNFGFVLANSNSKKHIGNVTVSKWGEPSLSPNILKLLKDDEIASLCRNAIKAFSILKGLPDNSPAFFFRCQKEEKENRYNIFKCTLQGDFLFGFINDKGRLVIDGNYPEYLRKFCVAELSTMANVPEFTYKNVVYNKK